MKIRSAILFAGAVALAMWSARGAIAADLTDVGYIDQAQLANLPVFIAANRQLASYKAQLDAQFNAQVKRARTDADKQQIAMQMQQQLNDKQREIVGPLFQRAQLAIAAVSATRNLSVIVDKRVVIYGGQDITKDVQVIFASPQAIQPPAATPPPSEIGYRGSKRARRRAEGPNGEQYDEPVREHAAFAVLGKDRGRAQRER